MSLSAEILCKIVGIESDSGDIARGTRITKADYFLSLSDGTAAKQAQIIWSDSRTCGGTDTLQLSSLPDTRDGASVSLNVTAVKLLYVKNTHGSNSLTVSAGSPFGANMVTVLAGGVVLLVQAADSGNAYGLGSVATHYVSATAGTTYDIVVIGEGSIT